MKSFLLLWVLIFPCISNAQYYSPENYVVVDDAWIESHSVATLEISLRQFDTIILAQPYWNTHTGDSTQLVFLIGQHDSSYVIFGQLIYPSWFGLNKVWFNASSNGFEICSQYPWKALTYCATYNDDLDLIGEFEDDPSEKSMDRSDSLLALGQVCNAYNEIQGVAYYTSYWNSIEGCLNFIGTANQFSGINYHKISPEYALKELDCAFEAFDLFVGFQNALKDSALLNTIEHQMGIDSLIRICLYYNSLLVQPRRVGDLISNCEFIIGLDPNTPEPYLTLGDKYRDPRQESTAWRYYNHYINLMVNAHREKEIPRYVRKRYKQFLNRKN